MERNLVGARELKARLPDGDPHLEDVREIQRVATAAAALFSRAGKPSA